MAGSWHRCHRPPIRMPFGRAALAGEEPAPATIVIFPSSVANAGARRAAQPKPKHFPPPWGSSGNTRCRDKIWGGNIPSHGRERKETTRISPQIMAQTWSRLLNPSCHLFGFFFPPLPQLFSSFQPSPEALMSSLQEDKTLGARDTYGALFLRQQPNSLNSRTIRVKEAGGFIIYLCYYYSEFVKNDALPALKRSTQTAVKG